MNIFKIISFYIYMMLLKSPEVPLLSFLLFAAPPIPDILHYLQASKVLMEMIKLLLFSIFIFFSNGLEDNRKEVNIVNHFDHSVVIGMDNALS